MCQERNCKVRVSESRACSSILTRMVFILPKTAILDPVMVKVEGKMVPLRDLAQVSIKDAKTLMVNINDVEVIEAGKNGSDH